MPIYEYRCPKCGAQTEKIQKMNDPAPFCFNLSCQEGDPVLMERQVSLGSFRLKGSGWYRDGYSKGK